MKKVLTYSTSLISITFFCLTAQASDFNFEVTSPQTGTIYPTTITGMSKEVQTIEYRHSNSSLFSTIKMPGIAKYGNITMTGIKFPNKSKFCNFYNKIIMKTAEKSTWTIKLLDGDNNIKMTWKLNNAWPTKISNTNLTSNGSFVNVNRMSIAHEQLIVTND
jgi:phage tail-like protein